MNLLLVLLDFFINAGMPFNLALAMVVGIGTALGIGVGFFAGRAR